MYLQFPELYAGNEVIRYLFRANHIYLLMAGLLNNTVGFYLVMETTPWRKTAQRVGSVLLLMAPVLLLIAFTFEPPQALPVRPITAAGLFAALFGVFCHGVARLQWNEVLGRPSSVVGEKDQPEGP